MGSEIKTPYFLVALPKMDDPQFSKTVVLMANHKADGAFGVILNKALINEEEGASAQMKAEIKDAEGNVVDEFNEDLFEGGPVHSESVFMLHDFSAIADQNSKIGEENIFLSSDPQMFGQVLSAVKDGSAHSRFFIGTSSWLPGQLDNEMRSGAWISLPFHSKFIFEQIPHEEGTPLEIFDRKKWQQDLWMRVLRAGGLDPLALSSQGPSDAGWN